MTLTIITTNTTVGVFLPAAGDGLIVSPTGTIIATGSVIDGRDATGQFVSIAGYVDIGFLWLGGQNNINIASGGVFNGHSRDTSIFVGDNGNFSVVTGGTTLNNHGAIFADHNAIKLFGTSNVINNTGDISANIQAIEVGLLGSFDAVTNSGTISSGSGDAVNLSGFFDSVSNSGQISSVAGSGVDMLGDSNSLVNTGTITSLQATAIQAIGGTNLITNLGSIAANHGIAIQMGDHGQLVNSGTINGTDNAIVADNLAASIRITNSGSITSMLNIAIDLTAGIGTSHMTNSGIVQGAVASYIGSGDTDIVVNSGTMIGNVALGAGNDTFDGRGGTVTGAVDGGTGSDAYFVDSASLVLFEQLNPGETDSVFSEVSYRLGINLENLTLLNAGNLNGAGNLSANVITGNAGDNRLNGSDGNDTLNGDVGNDRLNGGNQNDSLVGGDGDDTLAGQQGNDRLEGGDGDDVLTGGLGKDVMIGGTGQDVFVFATVAQSGNTAATADVIVDFTKGDDLINLAAIDANRGNATANDAFTFIGSAVFTGVAGQLHYVQTAGNTFVEMDVNGDGIADSVIQLNGLILLNAGDFVL